MHVMCLWWRMRGIISFVRCADGASSCGKGLSCAAALALCVLASQLIFWELRVGLVLASCLLPLLLFSPSSPPLLQGRLFFFFSV